MAIEVSTQGIIQAGEKLQKCSKELSNLFDDLIEITNSLSSNLSDSTQFNQILEKLNKIISTKDNIVSNINKFGNYLIDTVVPEYNSFMNLIKAITIDTRFFNDLQINSENKNLNEGN